MAWPFVSEGFDVLCAVQDAVAVEGMRTLAALGLEAGECSGGSVGAAGLLMADPRARAELDAGPESSVLVILTEGVTDPDAYARLVA